MPAIYLCNVIGTGTSRDGWRPSISNLGVHQNLMVDTGPKKRACVWSDSVSESGTGVILIQSAPSKDELIAKLQATNLTNPQRNQINNWLTASGYNTIPAGTINQLDVVLFVCRQVNPDVDLSVLAG